MRLDGYIRVSQVAGRSGESFISPKLQREQIEGWIKGSGAFVGEVFEELDESGARRDRPLLERAIERVEARESDGIVVAKLDRFGRSVIDGLRAIGRIEKAGGAFVSVQDGFDIRTPTGKLLLQILFSIGEWELERVKANWRISREKAIARGIYICRRAPIGYLRGEDGRLEIDPETATSIREMFERRARGDKLAEIAQFLNESDLETESGVPFKCQNVARMLRNCAYRGEARTGGFLNPEAHAPIVDPAMWHECQSKKRQARTPHEVLLSGRVRCAGCGSLMIPIRPENPRWPHTSYRCYLHRSLCPAPALARADELEPLVEDLIFSQVRRSESPEKEAIARTRGACEREGRVGGIPRPAGAAHAPRPGLLRSRPEKSSGDDRRALRRAGEG